MSAPLPIDAEAELAAALETCHQLISDPAPPATPPGYRGTIGHFPVYFPEEIPHAAGLLPVNVLGGGNRLEIRHADARLGSFVCSICRSTTERGLNGSLQGLQGFVTHPICDAAKHLAGIWSRNFPEQLSEILYLPQNLHSEGAIRYIADEYRRFLADVERRVGSPVTDRALRHSVRTYNANRRLLRELYQVRREQPWRVSLTESYLLTRARTRMPCEDHSRLLERALHAIARREIAAQDKPRVVLVGGFCEQPPLEMLEALDANCYVVDDDLLIGLRWFTDDVPELGDPLWGLAASYVERSQVSPVQRDGKRTKEEWLLAVMKESKADAAIVTAAKFCEPGLDDQLAWAKDLDKQGKPYLVLEFEEKMTSFEQMAMQVETFAESLLFALS